MGKLFLLLSAVEDHLWILAISLVVGSIVGLYYYLKIIVEMFKPSAENASFEGTSYGMKSVNLALATLVIIIVGLGVYPSSVLELINVAVVESFFP